MSDTITYQRTAKSSNPMDACRASHTQTQPVVSSSLAHRDTPAPPSLNGAELLRQNNSLPKPWSIHTIGNAIALCHNVACTPCTQYVEHLLLHMGKFGLPLEQVQEVASKAWPCLIETTHEEATRPLTQRLAGLQHYMQDKQEWHTDLEDALEDLRARHEDLKELVIIGNSLLILHSVHLTNTSLYWLVKCTIVYVVKGG
jgi:hypothetical protein